MNNTQFINNSAPGPLPAVMISLLGDFNLSVSGRSFPIGRGSKQERLLAELALAGREGLSRENLESSLWGSAKCASPRRCLSNHVYELNKAVNGSLGGKMLIKLEDGRYSLNIEAGVGVDIETFYEWAERGQAALNNGDAEAGVGYVRAALALYRDDLYVAESGRGLIEQEKLRTRFMGLWRSLIEYAYRQQQYEQVLSYLYQLLEYEPCHEGAHRLMMRCYMKLARRSQALRQYRICRRILEVEYGVEPEPETEAFFAQVRQDPGGVAADDGELIEI